MKKVLVFIVFVLGLVLSSDSTAQSYDEHCDSIYVLCYSDELKGTLKSVTISNRSGSILTEGLNFHPYLRLGIANDYIGSNSLVWDFNLPNSIANGQNKTLVLNQSNTVSPKRDISLYNSYEDSYDGFSNQVRFILPKTGSIPKCELSLGKPINGSYNSTRLSVDNNKKLYYQLFLNLIAKATQSDNKSSTKNIVLSCTNNERNIDVTFDILFEYKRDS